MNDFLKKNWLVLVAFMLPVLLIFTVALGIYLPNLFVKTDYNFVYATCTDTNYYYGNYNCSSLLSQKYSVFGSKILTNNDLVVTDPYNKQQNISFNSRLFLHNTKTNESRELSLSEQQQLILDNSLYTSPDGVTLSKDSTGGEYFMFPFGGSSYTSGWFLSKGRNKKKMNLINDNDRYYYQNDLIVLGWTKNK